MAKCYKTGKEAFVNRLEADLARAELSRMDTKHRKQRYRELPVRSYQCDFCKHWHHTSKAKGKENETQFIEW